MEIDEAKQKLREIYVSYGFEERPTAEGELTFFNPGRDYPAFSLDADEITEFAQVADAVAETRLGPVETCILADNFREQWVDFSDQYRGPVMSLTERDRVMRFGGEEDDGPYIEIGAPTPVFRNFFRSKGAEIPFFQERLMRRIGINRGVGSDGMFRRMLTVRAVNFPGEWNESLLRKTEDVIESCLFDLAYLKNLTLDLKTNWPLSFAERRRNRPFQLRPRSDGDVLPLRPLRYDSNVTKFYQRGLSSDDSYIAFISFYHILEYYFVSVSDAKLYSRLSRVINDPAFSSKQRYLDKLIQSVDEHNRESDETEMLKRVISEYVEEGELIDFISRYEEYLGTKIYTDKTSCFGYELEKMQIREGHIFGPVSKRIKTIRNALIHSSDRFERRDRYVPGEQASRILARELPLLRFLAEKVIIATAQRQG